MTTNVEQIYTGCLAHGAYYVESDGEAAIIDPLREVQPYIDLAESRGAKIKYVFETHFHADFVSGHVDLSEKTGAPIVFGPTTMETGFDAIIAEDGQEFSLGKSKIRLIHTPGHTPESSCFLLIDEQGKETSLFTGDTLFIGDVGRPDLAQKVVAELTQEKLASMMFDSLRNKIMPLADDIVVYPGHGAGSACGKNMSSETTDTLGHQKETNYALSTELDRESFIEALLKGLTPPPGYFPQNVVMNISGYENIDDVIAKGQTKLSPEEVERLVMEENAIVLDTRDANEFGAGLVPGSVNIGLSGKFANWVGVVFRDVKQPLVLVNAPGTEEEAAIRLARIGFDQTFGYLEGGVEAWKESGRELETIDSITAEELAGVDSPVIYDVRKQSEFDSEHVIDAVNLPLDYWWEQPEKMNSDAAAYVHCAGGYRSMVFASIMRSKGFKNLVNVTGGFKAMKDSEKFKLSEFVCPTTML
ncbi:MAG: MBL fold metallo-hydrolase [Aureliella sp.]